jgi:Flp pilus assembly protein TadD
MSRAAEKAAFDAALRDHQSGNLEAAIAAYRGILDRDPEIADVWHLLGVALHQKGDPSTARKLIESAIALDNTIADYHNNLGMVLIALEDYAAAERSLRQAVRIQPAGGKALANLAGLLRNKGLFHEAFDFAARAVAMNPNDIEAHNNLGNVLRDMARPADALAAYERAIALRPDFALAHWNHALVLLSLGHYADGFAELVWRWRWSGFPSKPRSYAQPLWDGSDIAGKTLFIYPEQGLGDVIQFVRYAALARLCRAHVIVEVPSDLAPLVQRAGIADEIVSGAPAVFDIHAPLLDLPHRFGTTLDTIPALPFYLAADPERVSASRAATLGTGGLRIGLNWSGNPKSPVEKFRSPPLEAFAPLAALDGIDWISLQKGPGGDALARPPHVALIETGETPIVETAALIASLDLVVTTDTAVAHLAGALGVPTYLMLHHASDWRWLLNRSDSPWYPSLRLFRQGKPGDWGPVMADLAAAVAKLRAERV